MSAALESGLSYRDAMRLTPYQIGLVSRASGHRIERQMEMLAWHAANIMNCWSKKHITPQRLLGKKPKTFDRSEEGQREFEEWAKKKKV